MYFDELKQKEIDADDMRIAEMKSIIKMIGIAD